MAAPIWGSLLKTKNKKREEENAIRNSLLAEE